MIRKFFLLPILLIFSLFAVHGQRTNVKFERISNEQGLSQNTVFSMFQDKEGFLWFGTLDGLNKYDGYEIKVYRTNPKDTNSIADVYITTIHEDSDDYIWFGTRFGGICRYDKTKNIFTNITKISEKDKGLSSNFITTIFSDNSGNLWIGTDNGLNLLDRKSLKIKGVYQPNEDKASKYITKILEDEKGKLWVATKKGLYRFDVASQKFSLENLSLADNTPSVLNLSKDRKGNFWICTEAFGLIVKQTSGGTKLFVNSAENSNSLSSNKVNTILEDNQGIIWVGTDKGLNKITNWNSDNYKIAHFVNDASDPYSISGDNILCLIQDRFNILWAGTNLKGLNKWDKSSEGIELYRNLANAPNSLSSNLIRSVFIDKTGVIWVGTVDAGLNKWDPNTGEITRYLNNPKDAGSLGHNHVRSILVDKDGVLWVGTDGGGLNKLVADKKGGKFVKYTFDENNPNSLSSNNVWKVIQDSKGTIWVATTAGLNKYNPTDETFVQYHHDPNNPKSISEENVTTVFEDDLGQLWVGTMGGGLNKYNEADQTFSSLKHNRNNVESISDNRIYSIVQDRSGIIWIGTKNGLNKFNRLTSSFKRYTDDDGLPNNVVMGILEDNKDNIWLSTNNGLSKFNKKDAFKNFDVKNGLQGNEFLVGAFAKSADGKLYFGGPNGLNTFWPDSVKSNDIEPQIVIYDLKIYNRSVVPGQEGSPLLETILKTMEITFGWDQNSFSFDFAALHFSQPSKNKYKYYMEGFDKQYIITDATRRFASYTNLSPGEYTFRVQGANSDGKWNEKGVNIKIIILPPYWKTWWFYVIIVLTVVGLFTLWYRSQMNKYESTKKELIQQVKDKNSQVEQSKFENIEQAKEIVKYRAIADNTHNAVVVMDETGKYLWVNKAYTQMFGYNFEQMIAQQGQNIISEGIDNELKKLLNKCIKDHEIVNYQAVSKSSKGEKVDFQMTLIPVKDNFGVVHNIVGISSMEVQLSNTNKFELSTPQKHSSNVRVTGQKIQAAVANTDKDFIAKFPDGFLLYDPKDSVSGDFYWYSDLGENKYVVAVGSTSGNGLPASFVTMIGQRLLDQIVNDQKVIDPKMILLQLDIMTANTLKEEEIEDEDAMEIGVFLVERKPDGKSKVVYSGAKRTALVYTDVDSEIKTLPYTDYIIGTGKSADRKVVFSNMEMSLMPKDAIYLFSPGATDILSYESKPLGETKLKDTLKQVAKLPMKQQQNILEATLDDHVQDAKPSHDITVIGLRI